jgi:hypothetical protein
MLRPIAIAHFVRTLSYAPIVWLTVFIGGCTKGSDSGEKASVPDLLEPRGAEISAYVLIPSLDAALSDFVELSRRLAPPDTAAPTLASVKDELGQRIGDPGLGSFDPTKPILVALAASTQPGQTPLFVGLLPTKNSERISALVAPFGLVSKSVDGLVAVGQTPQALELATVARSLYGDAERAGLGATGRVWANTNSLLATYGSVIEQGIAQLSLLVGALPTPGNTGTSPGSNLGALLEVEARAVLGLLGQLDALQVDIDLGKEWIAIDVASRGEPGAKLTTLFERSSELLAPTTSLVEMRDGLLASMALDPAALSAVYLEILDVLAAHPATKGFSSLELRGMIEKLDTIWDGRAVMAVKLDDSGTSMSYEMGVRSEADFLSILESSLRLLSSEGAFGQLYKGMGLEISTAFEKKARSRGNIAVHKFKVDAKAQEGAETALGANAEQLAGTMAQRVEIAVVADRGLAASVPVELDRMIDAAESKEPGARLELVAREVLGKGRQAYFDYGLATFGKAGAAGFPQGEARERIIRAFSAMSSVQPVLLGLTFDGKKGLVQARFPVEFFVKMREAFAPSK